MAMFKNGDIVFAEDINSKMIVVDSNDDKVICVPAITYDIDSLTLFKRPGITASQVEKEGIMNPSEVHVKDQHTRENLGYGKIYDYCGQTWIVYCGKVYPVQYVCGEYTIYRNDEPWVAVKEEDDIDQQESNNC